MATLLAWLPIQAKYLRDERWDIIGRAFQVIAERAGFSEADMEVASRSLATALLKAGAVEADPKTQPSPKGRFVPTFRLKPIGQDCKAIHIEAFDDKTIFIRKVNTYVPQED